MPLTGTLLVSATERDALVEIDGALRARSTVDLHGPHIGQPVVLMFEGGDSSRPIVMGVVRGTAGHGASEHAAGLPVLQLK